MIYAIRCGQWVKFGKANCVKSRMADLQIANPYKLTLLAAADWPNDHEALIHAFMRPHHQRGEWFRNGVAAKAIIEAMKDQQEGLTRFKTLLIAEANFRFGHVPQRAQAYEHRAS